MPPPAGRYRWALALDGPEVADRHDLGSITIFADEQARWLDDYALFTALKDYFQGAVWSAWPSSIRRREARALARWGKELGEEVLRVKFEQWQFFRQWQALKQRANQLGIRVVGDIPIFVAYDSADVWAHPELFFLDDETMVHVARDPEKPLLKKVVTVERNWRGDFENRD